MRSSVLGSAASYAGPGQACSGHLVEGAGRRIMLDCGSGTVSNLARACDPLTLDAVFISHGHVDHFADVYSLQSLLRYAPSGPAAPLTLYAPPGLIDRLGCGLTAGGAKDLEEAFVAHELANGQPVDVGGLTVVPALVVAGSPPGRVHLPVGFAAAFWSTRGTNTKYGVETLPPGAT